MKLTYSRKISKPKKRPVMKELILAITGFFIFGLLDFRNSLYYNIKKAEEFYELCFVV